MHFHKATHILGLLLIFLSVFMLLPVPFSLYYGENDAPAFLISAALSLVVGLIAIKRPASTATCGPKKASPWSPAPGLSYLFSAACGATSTRKRWSRCA